MAFPFLEVAGLGTQLLSGILQSNESKKRFRAMRNAARKLQQRKDREFNQAWFAIKGAEDEWRNDPARGTLRSLWEQRLKNPNVVSEADLSTMKQGALSEAGSESAGAITALREQAQRAGLGGSKMALGAEAGLRGRAFGRAAGLSNTLDLNVARANRESQDAVRSGYSQFVEDEGATKRGFAQSLAGLLGNRQYDESDLLAYA